MTDKPQPDKFDWATELSDAQGHVTLSAQEAHEIGARLRSMGAKLKTYEDLGGAADDVQLLRMGYAAARLEIESLRGKGWQPIETAPKDGTLILATIHIHCSDGTAAWQRHAIYFDAERNITYTDGGDETGWDFDDYQYWMPLPAAPAEGESQ